MTDAESPAGRGAFRPRAALLGALLLGAVAATFGNVLDNGFVYDDQLVIVDNPAVPVPLFDGFHGFYYRPLRTLSYRLDHALGGMDPRVFHVSNLVYHGATVLAVAAMLGHLGASPPAVLVGALVFAVHPVQADAVSYAAGRRDLLCGLFYALGILAFLRYRRSVGMVDLGLAAGAYVLAILAKEMAITLPVTCLLLDRWLGRAGRDATGPVGPVVSGRQLVRLAGLATVGLAALAFTYGRHILHIATQRPWHGGSIGANIATVARVWVKYLQLVLWPATLSVDYSYDAFPVSTTMLDPVPLASLACLGVLAVLAWRSWQRGGHLGLGLAWIAVTLLPVSHVVPFRELLAEHYLYVPMMGVAMIAAGAVDEVWVRWPARRVWISAVCVLVVGALAGRTVVRNRDWHDRVTLWSATVATFPRCARAQYNLGQAYFEKTRLAEAERAWLAAIALQPDDVEATRGLAMLDYRMGRHELAAAKVETVLKAKPKDGDALTLAGIIALDRGQPERALGYFDAALKVLRPARAEQARSGRDRAIRASSQR